MRKGLLPAKDIEVLLLVCLVGKYPRGTRLHRAVANSNARVTGAFCSRGCPGETVLNGALTVAIQAPLLGGRPRLGKLYGTHTSTMSAGSNADSLRKCPGEQAPTREGLGLPLQW